MRKRGPVIRIVSGSAMWELGWCVFGLNLVFMSRVLTALQHRHEDLTRHFALPSIPAVAGYAEYLRDNLLLERRLFPPSLLNEDDDAGSVPAIATLRNSPEVGGEPVETSGDVLDAGNERGTPPEEEEVISLLEEQLDRVVLKGSVLRRRVSSEVPDSEPGRVVLDEPEEPLFLPDDEEIGDTASGFVDDEEDIEEDSGVSDDSEEEGATEEKGDEEESRTGSTAGVCEEVRDVTSADSLNISVRS
jgi:hypothetical protein